MKNMFDAANVAEINDRLMQLKPESPPLWGTMSVAQALAHCSAGVEMATGNIRPKRAFLGRFLGPFIKKMIFRDDEPMRRNSPTAKDLVVKDERNFDDERRRLHGLIERFYTTGPAGCTDHPHAFFGVLTPEQWSVLMYKHLDHHLRQFGV